MTVDDERDAKGRRPGAPAWAGDLTTASSDALLSHTQGLRSHIAALTAKYEAHQPAGRNWRPATTAEMHEAGFTHWVARLIDAENERSKRESAP